MRFRVESGTLTKKEVTGVGYYTRGIITALSERADVKTEAFTLGSSSIQHVRPTPTLSFRYIRSLPLRIYRKLIQLHVAPPFDIFSPRVDVSLFPDFALWPSVKSKLRGVVIHDLTFMHYPEFLAKRQILGIKIPVTYWYLSSIVKHSAKHADFIVTVSSSVKDELMTHFKLPSSKIIVTPIPPHPEFLAQANTLIDKSVILEAYNIKTQDYILSVGTIEPRKNHLATLRAYLELPQSLRQKYSLVFAGGIGWNSDATINEIKLAQNKGENIIITGYFDMNHSYGLYHYGSLFTSASHYEGFGMPLLESLAAKTPMVLSNIAVFKEVARDAAIYIDTENTSAYAHAIENLLTNQKSRQILVNNGIERLKHYAWDDNAESIITHCRYLLQENK